MYFGICELQIGFSQACSCETSLYSHVRHDAQRGRNFFNIFSCALCLWSCYFQRLKQIGDCLRRTVCANGQYISHIGHFSRFQLEYAQAVGGNFRSFRQLGIRRAGKVHHGFYRPIYLFGFETGATKVYHRTSGLLRGEVGIPAKLPGFCSEHIKFFARGSCYGFYYSHLRVKVFERVDRQRKRNSYGCRESEEFPAYLCTRCTEFFHPGGSASQSLLKFAVARSELYIRLSSPDASH